MKKFTTQAIIHSFLLLTPYFSLIYAQAPDTLWTKTYGGIDSDGGYAVQQTFDSGYSVVGWTLSSGTGNYDAYQIKTDSLGDTLWTKAHDGLGDEVGRSVQQTTDGGYIIAGDSYIDGYDIYLIRTDSLGDTLWTKRYGGADTEKAYSVQQTSDNGYIIVGYAGAGTYDIYLIKTDSLGDTLWTKHYGGSLNECGYSVHQTTDNGYIIVGAADISASDEDAYLIRTDSNGDTLWTRTYGGADGDRVYSVQQTSDGGYIVAGRTLSFGAGSADVWLLKMASEPGIAEKEFFQNTAFLEINPNPFRQTTTIKLQTPGIKNQIELKIYDVTGHLVKDFNYISGNLLEQVTWTGEDNSGVKLPSGIYFLKFKFNNFTATRKLILLS